jgi:hypothetical protein
VYDTQCGAKVFHVNPNLVAAIERPFRSPWSFDVLLCQRLFDGTSELPGLPISSFLEMPLDEWTDVTGSKVNVFDGMAAIVDVVGMGITRRRRKQERGRVRLPIRRPPGRERLDPVRMLGCLRRPRDIFVDCLLLVPIPHGESRTPARGPICEERD